MYMNSDANINKVYIYQFISHLLPSTIHFIFHISILQLNHLNTALLILNA